MPLDEATVAEVELLPDPPHAAATNESTDAAPKNLTK